MRAFKSIADTAAKVNYGKGDKPDKYGFTKKMHKICDLVYEEKSIEDADFEPTKYDKAYYDECKLMSDIAASLNGGKRKRIVNYVSDIDPE